MPTTNQSQVQTIYEKRPLALRYGGFVLGALAVGEETGDDGALGKGAGDGERGADQLGAVPHDPQAGAGGRLAARREAAAVVRDGQRDQIAVISQRNTNVPPASMLDGV